MCLDGHDASPARVLTRRSLLRGAAGAAATMVVGTEILPSAASAASYDGLVPRSMAMHVHSSFSERTASMSAQLTQATQNAVDVLWWTDHDHRMSNFGYRKVVHFTALTGEQGDGRPWNWVQQTSGSLTAESTGGIVSAGSPNDTVAAGALSVQAKSTSSTPASLGFKGDSQPAVMNDRANVHGQTWTIEVLPESAQSEGYLELSVGSSYHPATGGRSAGEYSLSYHFGGSRSPGSREAVDRLGIITVPVTFGQWNTVALTLEQDIAALWPDMEARDFTTQNITLSAVSGGSLVSGRFDYLRFDRQYVSGDIPVQTQQSMAEGYRSRYPAVTQFVGTEMSLRHPHINWFGGSVHLPDYQGIDASNYEDLMRQQVQNAHSTGGLASFNHPYSMTSDTATPDSRLNTVATLLLGNKALGTDILEVGYVKNGVDLSYHVKLWDSLSRNALFMTGNGTNDDHFGLNWRTPANNWVTWVWSASNSEADLLAALCSGRSWAGSLAFRPTLDLVVDGAVKMGSVSVSSLNSRSLKIYATGFPSGGSVRVVRGVVDYASIPAPNTAPVVSLAPSAFTKTGSASVAIDTSASCFVRIEMLTKAGKVVSLSNPIWLLRETPPSGVPAARAA